MPPKQKAKIVKDVTQLVLARRTRMCNFLEYKGQYRCLPFTDLMAAAAFGRLEGRLSALCVSVLRNGHWPIRQ